MFIGVLQQSKSWWIKMDRWVFVCVEIIELLIIFSKQIIMYIIIVDEDDTKNASGLEMLNWRDVQSYIIWLPYQAIWVYSSIPFKNSSVEDFTIWTDNCRDQTNLQCRSEIWNSCLQNLNSSVHCFWQVHRHTTVSQTGKLKTHLSSPYTVKM